MTECDEIIIVLDNVSAKTSNTITTKKTNIIVTNVMSTALINCYSKKVKDSKPLRIRCYKIDVFVRIYDGARYLTLLGSEKYDTIYNRIRYLKSLQNGMTYIFSNYFAKIKVDSFDSLMFTKLYMF